MESSAATIGAPSRWQRIRAGLSPAEWRRAGGMAAVIVALHVVGFFLLFAVVVPRHFELGGRRACSASGSGSPPTRSACATPSTPTTSARSTTPPAS